MIRINLLPVPKVRRSEALILQGVAAVVVLFVVWLGCYFVTLEKQKGITKLNEEIAKKQQEIDQLRAKVGEVEKFKQQAQVLEQQLGVIRNLEKGRSGPVKMMDELTDLVPRKLWVNSFKESGKKVSVEGIAEGGPVIADFLDALKTGKHFTNPQLTMVTGVEQDGAKLHKFTLTVEIKYDI